VRFVKFDLTIKSVSFKRAGGGPALTIYKDLRGSTPSADPITAPQWVLDPPQSDPVLYVRNQKMRVDLQVDVENVQPPGEIKNVLIDGEIIDISGVKFHKTSVTLPASGPYTIADIDLDQPLPDNTHYYPDLFVAWKYKVGSNLAINFGNTTHDIWVSLEQPVANRKLYLSSIKLALKNTNENNVFGAFQQTWAAFDGPAHIKTWDNSPIHYYQNGFGASAFCNSATDDEGGILESADSGGSSQCTGLAAILQGALAVNGINSELVQIRRTDPADFMVHKWIFGSPSLNLVGSNVPQSLWQYRWLLNFSGPTIEMVPPPIPSDPTKFGDARNDLTGLNGQNTFPPAEKIFGNHVFILPHLTDNSSGTPIPVPTPGGPYYDPSYGVTYSGIPDFVTKAVAGIVTLQLNFKSIPNSKAARPVNSGDAAQFQLCTFATIGVPNCTAPTP